MYIEFGIYDDLTESVIVEKTFKIVENNEISGIAIQPFAAPYVINFLPKSKLLSCPIDWPYGLSTTKVRNFITINAIHHKIRTIDLVINPYLLLDKKKFTSFIGDIESHLDICKNNNVIMRGMIDSRPLSMETFNEVFLILNTLGVDTCVIGTSNFVDDFSDDLLMCKLIECQYGIRSILNIRSITEKQLESIVNIGLYGIRLNNNISSLDKLKKFPNIGVYNFINSTAYQDKEIFE